MNFELSREMQMYYITEALAEIIKKYGQILHHVCTHQRLKV